MNEENLLQVNKDTQKEKLRIKIKKFIKTHKLLSTIIISLLTLSILFLSIGLPIIISNNRKLSVDEEIAVEIVESLRTNLKDPDSLKLYDDVLVIWFENDDGDLNFYTYIDYGGKNSYGAMIRGDAMYKGYSYLGSENDLDEYDDIPIWEKASDVEYINLLEAAAAKSYWYLYGDKLSGDPDKGVNSYTVVEKELVYKVLGINE